MLTVTTSWDDGDVLDKRVVKILDTYGLKGTFYIPKEYWGTRLSDAEIRNLSNTHEVGAHTLSHIDLSKASEKQAQAEIQGSKEWLNEVCKKEIGMFCYPRGRYTPAVRDMTRAAGFRGARTTRQFELSISDPFEMPTSIQVYPFPFRHDDGPKSFLEPLMQRYGGYRSLGVPLTGMRSWESAAKAAFDFARTKGGMFHIWGHSWELEKNGLWEQFDRVCSHIANREDCIYVTNGELV